MQDRGYEYPRTNALGSSVHRLLSGVFRGLLVVLLQDPSLSISRTSYATRGAALAKLTSPVAPLGPWCYTARTRE